MCDSSQTSLGKNSRTFPVNLCSLSNYYKRLWPLKHSSSTWFQSFKVHAAVNTASSSSEDASSVGPSHGSQQIHPAAESSLPTSDTNALEMLAKAYIQQETGRERIRMIFKKDHMGKSSPEMEYIQVALAQTFVFSFLMKYVPEFRIAKQDFIREHHGTVFRTRLEAVRRMQDHISLRAAVEGGKFAIKMTSFGCSFLFLSQMIASYRNKTSVLEYTVAAGITGGLARFQLGIKGFIAGSFLGCVLGSLVGCLGYATLKSYDATQEQRHMCNIMSLLEVQKSVEGEHEFKRKIKDLQSKQLDQAVPVS